MTPLLLGLRISAGSSIAAMHEPESFASALAAAHFNALVWPGAADRHRMLNAALRHGVFVLAAPSADEPTMRAAAVSDVLPCERMPPQSGSDCRRFERHRRRLADSRRRHAAS